MYPIELKDMIFKKKFFYQKKYTPLQQYFFLTQVKSSGETNSSFYIPSTRKVHFRFKNFCKNLKGIILDIGGGDPTISMQLLPPNSKYLCLEPYNTDNKFKILGIAEMLPITDSKIDVVIFNTSLDHILDYHTAINEAYRVLKKNGKIVIATNIWIKDASLLKDDVHFHHFRLNEIMSVIKKKFIIKKMKKYKNPKNQTNRYTLYLMAQKILK